MSKDNITVVYRPISSLKPSEFNARKHTKDQAEHLKESLRRFGFVDPVLVNAAPEREGVIIGGHFRVEVAQELGITEVPVVFVNISDLEREKELCLRLNANVGEFDMEALADLFDEAMVADVGFTSEEMDDIFGLGEETPETFDIEKELKKLDIEGIEAKTGDIYLSMPDGTSSERHNSVALVGRDLHRISAWLIECRQAAVA